MFGWIGQGWRYLQRSVDLHTLWPACKEQAPNFTVAKAAFSLHAFHDDAWTADFTHEEIKQRIDDLQ